MKKLLPLLIVCSLGIILPSAIINSNKEAVAKAQTAPIDTYLVLTENGLYNGEKGEKFPELFLENTVKYSAEAGSELPGSDVITSSVSGVTFNGWVIYEGLGVPSGVSTVDAKHDILYASWVSEGSSTGGGGTPTGEKMKVYFKAPADWTTANIYVWRTINAETSEEMSVWPGTVMEKDATSGLFYYEYDTSYYTNVIFNNGTAQTGNLKSPTSEDADCYVWNNGWYNEDTSEEPKELEAGLIYFKPNQNWKTDSAWFAAWTWDGSANESWITFTDSNGDGIYEAELAAGRTGMKFVRMDPSVSTPSWDNGKWNATGDVNIPTDGKNMFTLSEGSWDNGSGTWSTYNG